KLMELSESRENLLRELDRLRKQKKDSYDVSVLDELKSRKKALMDEINNLVGEMSKSAAASKYIIPQIESRDEELKELNEKIAKLEKESDKNKKETESFDLVVNNIFNFANVIDELSDRE